MKAKVEKVEKFVKENAKAVIAMGVTSTIVGVAFAYSIGCRKGVNAGVCLGFNEAIDWCGRHFPETDIVDKYTEWVAANADKMIDKIF